MDGMNMAALAAPSVGRRMYRRALRGLGADSTASSWMSDLTKFLPAASNAFSQSYSTVTGKPVMYTSGQQPLVQTSSVDNLSKILLYGGIAVGGIALLMYLTKKRG